MRPDWEEAIARALMDRRYRARLLGDPVEALRAYHLEPWQQHLLNDLHAQTLDQLIAHLQRIHLLPAIFAGEERSPNP
jgi:hypothetical protein